MDTAGVQCGDGTGPRQAQTAVQRHQRLLARSVLYDGDHAVPGYRRAATQRDGHEVLSQYRDKRSEYLARLEENHPMTTTQTEELALTPTQIEGPYYKVGSPRRSTLIEPGISGTPLVLTGQVMNDRGKPIPGAVLDFWQSDDRGNYDMVGNSPRGHVLTVQDGRYSLETIVPACYEPRQARHIHVKVQGVSRPYTTQLYFSDDPDRVKDNFYMKELEVQVDDLPDGRKRGQYTFVIRQVTEKDNVTPESLAARVA